MTYFDYVKILLKGGLTTLFSLYVIFLIFNNLRLRRTHSNIQLSLMVQKGINEEDLGFFLLQPFDLFTKFILSFGIHNNLLNCQYCVFLKILTLNR